MRIGLKFDNMSTSEGHQELNDTTSTKLAPQKLTRIDYLNAKLGYFQHLNHDRKLKILGVGTR